MGLRAGALAGVDHEQEEVDPGGARDHRPYEALVSGHVHDGQPSPVGQLERRVPEVDGDAALLLLGQAVGVLARQRRDEPGLPVVDVAGRADGQRHRASMSPSRIAIGSKPPAASSARHCVSSRSRPPKTASPSRSSHRAQ